MTKSIEEFLLPYKGKKLLAIFPHHDDVSFVAGGLFQLLQKLGINTKLICLSSDNDSEEFKRSCRVLGIDEVQDYNIPTGQVRKEKSEWTKKVENEILRTKPFAVLTFDPHGITGNTDHVESSVEVLKIIGSLNETSPILFWRISDKQEKNYFEKKDAMHLSIEPSHHYFLTLSESIKKLKAIFCFKNRFGSLLFKMRILEWYLFDHKEVYHKVDFSKSKYQLIPV